MPNLHHIDFFAGRVCLEKFSSKIRLYMRIKSTGNHLLIFIENIDWLHPSLRAFLDSQAQSHLSFFDMNRQFGPIRIASQNLRKD